MAWPVRHFIGCVPGRIRACIGNAFAAKLQGRRTAGGIKPFSWGSAGSTAHVINRIFQAGHKMKHPGLLAIIPFIGMLAGPMVHNSVTPYILGMPFSLGWVVVWVFITSGIMALIHHLHTRNTGGSR